MTDQQGPNSRKKEPTANPDKSLFQELESGILRLTEGHAKQAGPGHLWSSVRRFAFGPPLATAQESEQRLSKLKALPILASDNISSSAYATEEIARVLVIAGIGALSLTLPITLALIAVLAIVVLSYTQIIRAYPQGGGSYTAARKYLGVTPGLVVASSLLIDYVLTVAVSVAAGVEALTSVAPQIMPFRIPIILFIIAFLVIGNLRGVRQSGTLFSIPTYFYILGLFSLLAYGGFRLITGTLPTFVPPSDWTPTVVAPLGFLIVLRAFASGAVALTGVEAVADGTKVVKPPETRNANTVLLWMAVLFAVLFLGISVLGSRIGLVPDPAEQETLLSLMARTLVGSGWLHLLLQIATALILLLAANTALVGFPRLASVLATDRFFPNQFLHRGDRLALSTGIIAVGALAGVFVVAFHGSVAALIPLYTVGVFIAFTLSQAGMIRHWRQVRGRGWRLSAMINGLGMIVTGTVAIEAVTVKFLHGAWIVFVLIPLLAFMMFAIRRHYQNLGKELTMEQSIPVPVVKHPTMVLMPIADMNRASETALAYAQSLAPEVRALHVTDSVASAERLRGRWAQWGRGTNLVIIEAPFRNWVEALLRYVDSVREQMPNEVLTVVIPEFVPRHWWENLLHSQSALRLKMALQSRPNVVVVDVPYHCARPE